MAGSLELGNVLLILKELQKASRLQQEQIDKLITAVELSHNINNGTAQNHSNTSEVGMKRKLSDILENSSTEQKTPNSSLLIQGPNGEVEASETSAEKKEHLDKMLEKTSFSELWNNLSVKLKVSDSVNGLKEKDKIREILEKACERTRVAATMNYDTLLTATLRRYSRDTKPEISTLFYTATNADQAGSKRTCYAHNIEKFKGNMEDFYSALVDPCRHFLDCPRKYLLSDSCFSSTAQLEFRSKRQRLPFAICCIRKPGFLSFFVGDWAYDDKELPNSSNLNHYTTLKMDKFIQGSDLETEQWKSMASILEGAACPSDLDIGSVTMFMHEHRGNIVCAKVMLDKESNKHNLRIYPHASYKIMNRPVILNFDDDGERYTQRIKDNLTFGGPAETNVGVVNIVEN